MGTVHCIRYRSWRYWTEVWFLWHGQWVSSTVKSQDSKRPDVNEILTGTCTCHYTLNH